MSARLGRAKFAIDLNRHFQTVTEQSTLHASEYPALCARLLSLIAMLMQTELEEQGIDGRALDAH